MFTLIYSFPPLIFHFREQGGSAACSTDATVINKDPAHKKARKEMDISVSSPWHIDNQSGIYPIYHKFVYDKTIFF